MTEHYDDHIVAEEEYDITSFAGIALAPSRHRIILQIDRAFKEVEVSNSSERIRIGPYVKRVALVFKPATQ